MLHSRQQQDTGNDQLEIGANGQGDETTRKTAQERAQMERAQNVVFVSITILCQAEREE